MSRCTCLPAKRIREGEAILTVLPHLDDACPGSELVFSEEQKIQESHRRTWDHTPEAERYCRDAGMRIVARVAHMDSLSVPSNPGRRGLRIANLRASKARRNVRWRGTHTWIRWRRKRFLRTSRSFVWLLIRIVAVRDHSCFWRLSLHINIACQWEIHMLSSTRLDFEGISLPLKPL